jgi:hypothetical protein
LFCQVNVEAKETVVLIIPTVFCCVIEEVEERVEHKHHSKLENEIFLTSALPYIK